MRREVGVENLLGRGNSYTLSGEQWGDWNAVFGPRGADGRPVPLWDPQTGKINHAVAEQWKKYDLRLVLETNWKTLGPKLRGKLHIAAGEADDYFLNNAVHLLDRLPRQGRPALRRQDRLWPRQGPRLVRPFPPPDARRDAGRRRGQSELPRDCLPLIEHRPSVPVNRAARLRVTLSQGWPSHNVGNQWPLPAVDTGAGADPAGTGLQRVSSPYTLRNPGHTPGASRTVKSTCRRAAGTGDGTDMQAEVPPEPSRIGPGAISRSRRTRPRGSQRRKSWAAASAKRRPCAVSWKRSGRIRPQPCCTNWSMSSAHSRRKS